MPPNPEKEALEIEKLKPEVDEQQRNRKFANARLVLDIAQGLSIIAAIVLGVNEFVVKDREGEDQRTKITLEYLNNISTDQVASAYDFLVETRDAAFAVPVPDPHADVTDETYLEEEKIRRIIDENFEKETFALCHYYNVLNQGIKKGLFDRELAEAFLSKHVEQSIMILGEIQSRVGRPGDKAIIPDYHNFEGMIEFYIRCFRIKKEAWHKLPLYDINRPGRTAE